MNSQKKHEPKSESDALWQRAVFILVNSDFHFIAHTRAHAHAHAHTHTHTQVWSSQPGWESTFTVSVSDRYCQRKKNNTPRTRVFFVKHDHLVESYSYKIIISNLDVYCVAPIVVMFHWSIATEINNDIIADMTRPDCVIRVVLATSKLSIGIDMASIKYNNPPWSAYDKRGISAGNRSGWKRGWQ